MPAKCQENHISNSLYKSEYGRNLYEIGRIEFEGNKYFNDETLKKFISSHVTEKRTTFRILEAYKEQLALNPITPKKILINLENTVDRMSATLDFFDKSKADADSASLWNFYNTNGFHFVELYYSFSPDTINFQNVLTFHIELNDRYKFKPINYIGLDTVNNHAKLKINREQTIRAGEYFDEKKLANEIASIQNILLNEGYFYSKYEIWPIKIDTLQKNDSVIVEFSPGIRQKISSIEFNDIRNNQPSVANIVKKKLLEFHVGDWYSKKKVNNSVDNLLSIGTFDIVSIDTINTEKSKLDSTLEMSVKCQYRKHREWNVGAYLNKTPVTGYLNSGIEGSIFHRNLFGAAQATTLYGKIGIKDVSRSIAELAGTEYETQIGVKYQQPLMWILDNSRVSLSTQFSYSYETISNFFKISRFAWPLRFPFKLPDVTYFNTMVIEFNFERENPINYEEAVDSTSSLVLDETDLREFFRAGLTYESPYYYLKDDKEYHLLTSNIFGFSIISDHRNHPFSPTSGDYTFISLEGWNFFLAHPTIAGISKYYRFQFLHTHFWPMKKNLVLATKGRIGFIRFLDSDNNYISIERQFFAGGANSIRGWPARRLHYSNYNQDENFSRTSYNFLSDIVGSAGIFESSVELRYKFQRPKGWNKTIANQIANLGITAFADVGNAYHWLIDDSTDTRFVDYFTKLAWAFGIGLRYSTPIGPVRIDFALPIYGPVYGKDPFIFRRNDVFEDMQIHFGIGHAF